MSDITERPGLPDGYANVEEPRKHPGIRAILSGVSQNWLLFITGLGLLTRLSYALVAGSIDPFLRDNPLHGDAGSYDLIIRSLLAGTGYAIVPPTPDLFWPPLFPLLMWASYSLFGYDLSVGRLMLALFSAAVPLLTYLLGKHTAGERAARLASLGAVLYPHLVYFGAWLVAEPVYLAVLTGSLVVASRVRARPTFSSSALLGLALGLGLLAKPSAAFLLPGLAVWFLVAVPGKSSHRLSSGLICFLVLLATLSPWLARNYLLTDSLMMSANGGYTFYGANNAEAFGGHREGFPVPLTGLSSAEQDREYYRLALTWISDNPRDFGALVANKFARLASPLSVASWETDYPLPLAGLVKVAYWAFLALAVVGMVVARPFWRSSLILFVPMTGVLLSTALFYGDARYALPMVPSLLVFAALAIVRLRGSVQAWRSA